MYNQVFVLYKCKVTLYQRVKSDLKYSALPKIAPPLAAHLTKPQVQQMRDWRIKYGQSVPQKTVRKMSTKDNSGTLPINLYAQAQLTSEPLDFSKIAENVVQAATHPDNSHDLLYTSEDVVYLGSDATGRMMVYVLQENVSALTKKARATFQSSDIYRRRSCSGQCDRHIWFFRGNRCRR